MIKTIDARVARAMNQVRKAFRAVLSRTNTAPGVSLVQAEGLAGEAIRDAELFQHFGLTSAPPAGTMAVVLPIGGKTAHGVVVATEHASFRIADLGDGEVAVYDAHGHSVELRQSGIVIKGGGDVVTITDTPTVRVEADIEATGEITDRVGTGGKTMAHMRSVYNTHTHPENDSGGPTDPPIQGMN